MPKVALTAKFIESLKADTQTDYYDILEPGLALRVSPRAKVWSYLYRLPDGKRRRYKLGTYPTLTLADARDKARETRRAIEKEAADPQHERQQARKVRRTDRFVDLAKSWLSEHATVHKRTFGEDMRKLERDILPALGETPAKKVTRADVKALLRSIVDRGSIIAAHRTGALISAIYNYGIGEGMVEHNPALRMPRFGAEPSRERVLSTAEIRSLWLWCDHEGPVTGGALRWLLLTAARRNEALQATWSEIAPDLSYWELPAARTKNGRVHRLPIVPQTRAILEALPHRGPWLFPSGRRLGPLVDLRPSIRRLCKRDGLEPFRIHDLRRTCLTGLAELRIPGEVRDAIANHKGRGGVRSVYDRHHYFAEKREALEAWGRRVVEIAEGREPAAVVPISSRR